MKKSPKLVTLLTGTKGFIAQDHVGRERFGASFHFSFQIISSFSFEVEKGLKIPSTQQLKIFFGKTLNSIDQHLNSFSEPSRGRKREEEREGDKDVQIEIEEYKRG